MEEQNQLPKRKNVRLKDFDYSSLRAYFVTVCTKDKKSYFINEDFNRKIVDCLNEERKRLNFLIYVYCLMPNHFHVLLSPPGDGDSVSQFVGAFKSKTTRIGWDYGVQGKLWQGRFYDHVLRKKDKMNTIDEYILNNPVRMGIVEQWQKYKWYGIIDYWI